jgi:hypothetical protein
LVSNGGDCEPKDDGWRINLSAFGAHDPMETTPETGSDIQRCEI